MPSKNKTPMNTFKVETYQEIMARDKAGEKLRMIEQLHLTQECMEVALGQYQISKDQEMLKMAQEFGKQSVQLRRDIKNYE